MKSLSLQKEFIRLRAEGHPLAEISQRLNTSKPTLLKWHEEFEKEINNSRFEIFESLISGSEAEFLNYDQYRTALEMKVLEHHFCININTHIEKLFKNFEIDMPFTESHDFESFELVYAMKRADFDKMTIHKKKGKVLGFDLEKTFPNTESQKALVADHPDCELTIKRRKNQVTSIRRKSTKKFDAQG